MKILVIRRDNIGDLVCTTPLLAALRRRHPEAWIGVLANSYNAPVLERNPDVSAVISYQKLKHLEPGESALAALGRRLAAFWQLRQMKLDFVVLATPGAPTRGLRLARWLKPAKIVRFDDSRVRAATLGARHEVELVFSLAKAFDVQGAVPGLVLVPDPRELERARALLASRPGRRIAVHISARRRAQRWPAQRFAELIGALHAQHGALAVLLWSPGPPEHARHPGDDDKAAEVLRAAGAGAAVIPYPTARLAELIGALAACDEVICSDGGAMHLAAALGKPVVALFGDAPAERWRPWGTRHRIVRPPSRDLADLPVETVLAAYRELTAGD
ncbi:MAG: glycosyltransferase family 9 protein [Betaproteobacteria bacterium]|nr:glycosyltransferase family 9 protein [Betaproteobacteria bacterium]